MSQKIVAKEFNDCGLKPSLLAIVEKLFSNPTPIQSQVIPVAVQGQDVVGIAQTGTGKTLAFGLPMLQNLAEKGGQGLILVPTRELALQVEEMIQKIGKDFNLRLAVIMGGASMNLQIKAIKRNPHIFVATPGRMVDLLNQRKISLEKIKIVVLDEADRMLDIGFMPQIKEILRQVPENRQTMLFSATMPVEVSEIARAFMKQPLRIEVAPAGTASKNVEQSVYFVKNDQKKDLLLKILRKNSGTVLIFCRTKFGAKKLSADLRKKDFSAVEIHSERTLYQRQEAMAGFKNGKYQILVATDIAARGIDVKNISLVINFDVPDNNEDYVHRIGRTGRAESRGKAITFAKPDQKRDIKEIERLVRQQIPVESFSLDGVPVVFNEKESFSSPNRFKKNKFFKDKKYSRKNSPKNKRNTGRERRSSDNYSLTW